MSLFLKGKKYIYVGTHNAKILFSTYIQECYSNSWQKEAGKILNAYTHTQLKIKRDMGKISFNPDLVSDMKLKKKKINEIWQNKKHLFKYIYIHISLMLKMT